MSKHIYTSKRIEWHQVWQIPMVQSKVMMTQT